MDIHTHYNVKGERLGDARSELTFQWRVSNLRRLSVEAVRSLGGLHKVRIFPVEDFLPNGLHRRFPTESSLPKTLSLENVRKGCFPGLLLENRMWKRAQNYGLIMVHSEEDLVQLWLLPESIVQRREEEFRSCCIVKGDLCDCSSCSQLVVVYKLIIDRSLLNLFAECAFLRPLKNRWFPFVFGRWESRS